MRKIFWRSVSFLTMTWMLVSCCKEDKAVSQAKQILRLNLADDPVSLDPRLVRSLRDLTLVKQLYEGLMRLDGDAIPQPALAEKIDISDDLLTYTFSLREAYWSNGDPVTAYDFEYAWMQTLAPNFASDYAYILYPIKNAQLAKENRCPVDAIGVLAIDDKTLSVQLKAPTPYFLELLAFPTYFPVNHHCENACVFNGPFCLTTWSPQKEVVLEKNPCYWDKNSVHLDKIIFSVITDNTTASLLFEKNELDWLGQPISHSITTENIAKLKAEGQLSSYPVAGTFWLKFNTEKEPFNNAKLRKAFAYAINRQEIITHILQGNQSLATGVLPPSMVSHSGFFSDGDLGQATRLFHEALEEKECSIQNFPRIVFNYSPSERNTKIVQLVQQQWQTAFGIQVELAPLETQLYRRIVRQGHFQVGTGEWVADYHDPLAFLELFKFKNDSDKGHGMNDTGWHNERFTALLDDSLIECDGNKRRQLLEEAEEILVQEMPVIPIYHYAFDYVKKPYVQDVFLSPLGLADFKTTSVKHFFQDQGNKCKK